MNALAQKQSEFAMVASKFLGTLFCSKEFERRQRQSGRIAEKVHRRQIEKRVPNNRVVCLFRTSRNV
jgi:hypothetical protein